MLRRFIILFAVVLVLLVLRIYRKKVPSAGVSNDPNLFMPSAAEDAIDYASERGKKLDYSVESVKSVDALLGELHEVHAKGNLSDKDVKIHAPRFGAYIGEVIRRGYGGTWAIDHSVAGPGSFPLHWKSDSFPVTWCGKRILNGEEDNVRVKFQVVTSDEYQNQPAPTTQNDQSTDSSVK